MSSKGAFDGCVVEDKTGCAYGKVMMADERGCLNSATLRSTSTNFLQLRLLRKRIS